MNFYFKPPLSFPSFCYSELLPEIKPKKNPSQIQVDQCKQKYSSTEFSQNFFNSLSD
jgi:hypothetical protein